MDDLFATGWCSTCRAAAMGITASFSSANMASVMMVEVGVEQLFAELIEISEAA